jgi:dimethylglycine oxidase
VRSIGPRRTRPTLVPPRILTATMAGTPRVVIIGAGIVGCSLADELVLRGWRDVTVVEQGPLFKTGGSTSHAPGIIFQTNASKTMQGFATYTIGKAASLELDGRWCLNPVGSLELALTTERLSELHRRHDFAESWGLAGRVIDPDETAALWPFVDRSRIVGAYHVPSDGLTDAVRVSEAQARRATEGGARFLGAHTVTGIRTDDGRVRGVITDRGELRADIVVAAAGIWGPRIGALVGMTTALQPLAHQLTWTTPLPEVQAFGIPPDRGAIHPNIRVQDRDMYLREYPDRLAVGGYGHVPLPVDSNDLLHPTEAPVMPSVLEFTPDTFAETWSWAEDLVPALRAPEARIERGINGIFSFTPDGFPLMGESRDVRGFWVAEAVWVTHALGVGRAMAEWLVDGGSTSDLHESDLNRFEAHQLSPSFIHDRGIQNYVEVYDIIHPLQPMEEPRPLRTSPFYEREGELGAYFLEGGGWERPHWYGVNESLLGRYDIPGRNPWAARYWHPIVGAEARATRDGVALYDITPLKRIAVEGDGAPEFLDRMTTNRVDRPVGTVVYSLLLDERGGVRSDLTIARLAQDRFQVGANGPLDLDLLQRQAPRDGSVSVRDITSATCCIGLWGPRARDVLSAVTDADLSNDAFRYFQARDIWVGTVPVTALRLSYVGELGWELYTPAEMGLRLWDTLWAAGREHGLIAAGRGAFGSLRLEKGYRFSGVDMTTEHDPYEAGLGFAVRMDKGDFVGRDALVGKSAKTVERRLVPLLISDPQAVVMGKEPVHVDGRPAGYVTSAGFGYTIGSAIAYAWLPATAAQTGNSVTIRYFGEDIPASVADEPLFDPEMRRLRS